MEPELPPSQLDGLQSENIRLQELDELKNIFISTASHQFRTPLTALKWILSSLETDPELQRLASKQLLIKQASVSVDRIIDLVNDLLNASRIQDGHLPYHPQSSDFNKLVTEGIAPLRDVMTSRSLHFEEQLLPNLPIVLIDPLLVKEALHNLMNNAIDYTPDGGSIQLVTGIGEQSVFLRVSDSGEGIPIDEMKKVSMPFFRGINALRLHPDGSGLGLYLTEAIMREHGGSLRIDQPVSGGTAVTLTFPPQHSAM